MERIYRYDLSKLIKRLTPPRWRNPFNLNWYESLLSQVDYSQDRFEQFKDKSLVELSYNAQTCYLEKMLCDKFDPVHRRIFIQHEEEVAEFWYRESEGQLEKYLYRESETGATETYLYVESENTSGLPEGIDFRVVAPSELSSVEDRMRSEIQKYKLAAKQYDITFS